MRDAPNVNQLWASLIVEELVRGGIGLFCISSGSRSAPLATAVARNPRAQSLVHYDERGAAYFALGYARASGTPAALVCTSGTAVGNYFPALIEAAHAGTPIIVLTADRPPELLDTGANQTIDQPGIYGRYVRWQATLSCPTTKIPPEALLTTVDQAVCRALGPPAGPVHLNCPFREPLAPTPTGESFDNYLSSVQSWLDKERPYTVYASAAQPADDAALDELVRAAKKTRRGIVVAGQLRDPRESDAVLRAAQALRWPLFPDVTSGLRMGVRDLLVVPYYDQLLLSESFAARRRAEAVLHVGGPVVSKRLLDFFRRTSPPLYVHVADHNARIDPVHRVTLRIVADIPAFCRQLASTVGAMESGQPTDDARLADIHEDVDRIDKAIEEFLADSEALSEPAVSRTVSTNTPEGTALFLGNSMPIRDMDMFAAPGSVLRVFANRGSSGIDGNIATAAGIAHGLGKPVVAILGDLACLHDLNSLALLAKTRAPVVLIVINNDGSAVFHFLPISQFQDVFERYFATPHGLRFERAAEMFGLHYAKPSSIAAFLSCYRSALRNAHPVLIEATIDRTENFRLHQALHERVKTVLD